MKGRSTTSNLFEITHYMQQHAKDNDKIDVVYFDYSMAFDHVDHALLAAKLASISMRTLYRAIITFICHRVYTLKMDGQVSAQTFMSTSGVPQDSHCGPLLYLIMCRDMVLCIANTGALILMYADDTKIYRIVNTVEDMEQLQMAIDNLAEWSQRNKLQLNASKTYHVSYSKRK